MSRHWKGIWAIFAVTLVAFGIAIATGSTTLAIIVLPTGLVAAFVLGTAWMRPSGSPKERHERHDHLLNDTRP